MGSEDSEIILVFVSAAAVILLMAILISFFVAIYQKRILKQDQHLQQLENDFQKGLLKATIEGQERERKRLAKDLHDGIGSLLTGLNLNLKHQLQQSDPNTQQTIFLTEACKMLEEGIGDVRRVSHNLLPITLENFGLLQALEEWIESLQQPDFGISLQHKGQAVRLPAEIELGLLRICQELLQNTIRHAEASEATIELNFIDKEIHINYSDNGKGFDESQQSLGIGIKNIQSRLQALSGTLNITTKKGQGFKALVIAPLLTPTTYDTNDSNSLS